MPVNCWFVFVHAQTFRRWTRQRGNNRDKCITKLAKVSIRAQEHACSHASGFCIDLTWHGCACREESGCLQRLQQLPGTGSNTEGKWVVKHTLFENHHTHLHRLHHPARVKRHALGTDLHSSKRFYYKKGEVAWSDMMSNTLSSLKKFLLSQALNSQVSRQRCSCAVWNFDWWFTISTVASLLSSSFLLRQNIGAIGQVISLWTGGGPELLRYGCLMLLVKIGRKTVHISSPNGIR